jgi:hypothetical protein
VSAARGSGILDDAHAGRSEQRLLVVRACELRTACRDDVGGTTCRSADLQEFLTWLPLFVPDKWSDRWCDAVYGSMEPAKVIDTYFESCKARQCNYASVDQSVA